MQIYLDGTEWKLGTWSKCTSMVLIGCEALDASVLAY